MAGFPFDSLNPGHSPVNALALARAAALAYSDKEAIEKTIRDAWGFSGFLSLDDPGTDTQAFLAVNDDMVLISFRGTQATHVKDLATNVHIKLVSGPAGKVHEGFLGALGAVWDDLIKFIRNERGSRALWVTGHSLGAALATLAVARLRLESVELNGLYTFGSPRVGDEDFTRAFDADIKDQTFRYVNNNDVVPRVPPRLSKYDHVGTIKYFDTDGDLHGELPWLEKLKDRLEGRWEDFLKPGTDGIKDHDMKNYITNLEKAKAASA